MSIALALVLADQPLATLPMNVFAGTGKNSVPTAPRMKTTTVTVPTTVPVRVRVTASGGTINVNVPVTASGGTINVNVPVTVSGTFEVRAEANVDVTARVTDNSIDIQAQAPSTSSPQGGGVG